MSVDKVSSRSPGRYEKNCITAVLKGGDSVLVTSGQSKDTFCDQVYQIRPAVPAGSCRATCRTVRLLALIAARTQMCITLNHAVAVAAIANNTIGAPLSQVPRLKPSPRPGYDDTPVTRFTGTKQRELQV